MAARKIDAVIFDLYDTLVRIRKPVIRRKIPPLFGVNARRWMELVRARLLTTAFSSREEFVRLLCDELASDRSAEREEACLAAVDEEIQSIETIDGVVTTLTFLKRRGFKLGLLSNLTSIHKEPVARLGLAEFFDAVSYSCDEGICKPEPRIYLDLCHRLEVSPESSLMVGNSLPNDVRAAEALGMKALHVDGPSSRESISSVKDIGWMDLCGRAAPEPLLSSGREFSLFNSNVIFSEITPLGDTAQGRHNLVASARVAPHEPGRALPGNGAVFCKRFVYPEAAYVEEFAHQLMAEVGLPSCDAVVSSGPEPCLIVTEAPGKKFEGGVDPALAYELGRHSAVAYLLANADLRPRNTFVEHNGPRPVVTMVDLEHCFFNLALDPTGLDDPLNPETLDQLSEEEVAGRLRRQVLTERTTRRAMKTFLEIESRESAIGESFKDGWVAAFERVRKDWDRIASLMEERLHREPFLIIGTRSYRRAMAQIDISDMEKRVAKDPEDIFPSHAAFKRTEGAS